MNAPDHPNICTTLRQPVLQDYGFDGWKASREEIERTFMDIVIRSLEKQEQDADKLKGLIAHYGPRISEVPYRGLLVGLRDWFSTK